MTDTTEPTTPPQAQKPGFKTTEFWLTLLANAIGGTLASGLVIEDSTIAKILGVALMLLSTLGYQYARAKVKTAVINAAPMLALFLLGALAVGTVGLNAGCGQSQREKTIHAALLTTDAAHDGFVAYDRERQAAIVESAASREQGAAALAEYRASRARIVELFDATYRAIAAAAVLEDDHSKLETLSRAAGLLAVALHDFTGGKL